MMPTKHGEELVNDIYSCAYNGQDQMVAEWLRRQPGLLNMPEKNSDLRETILHRAVAAGRINTVFLILEQDGVDLFSLNSSGNAALHVVIGGLFSPQNELIRGDYYQIAELLVAANPEILNQKSAKDGDRSRTPLELVALLGGEKSP
ncbi:MAG: ankyrin repeat domain-containing protein, partial [Gammaproteobacteria bacterium]|nr:ankyrin repeat domain-containing protein [Gammaproteobacteria bacterium]